MSSQGSGEAVAKRKGSLNLPGGGLLRLGRAKSAVRKNSGSDAGLQRQSSLVSRASSRILSTMAKGDSPMKYARDSIFTYFQEKEPPNYGDMAIEEKNVVVKVLKTTMGTAVPRWTKLKGSVRVGAGRIHIILRKKHKVNNWVFEVGQIKTVSVKGIYSKEMTIAFHTKNVLLRLVLDKRDKCQKLIHQLLYEAQAMSVVFHKVLLERLTDSWKKVLKLDKFHDSVGVGVTQEAELSEDEERQLNVDEDYLKEIEQLLKEEIDLNVIGRGRDHPDTSESMDRLGLFLKRLARLSEGEGWLEQAKLGRESFAKKSRSEFNIENAVEDKDIYKNKNDLKGIEQVIAEMPGNKQGADYELRMKFVNQRLEAGVTQPEDHQADEGDMENLEHML